ncbi:MAG: pilus assembly protein PilM, partial [Candidatus Omnitrophica bacterium]|nr:pilus assembly protein PilM [Candidatus Omnitrophota bacterium]
MLNKSSDFIAISLTEEDFKFVHVKGSGKGAKIVNVAAADVKGLSPADLPRAISSALGKINKKAANVLYVVPPNMVTTKNIEVPSSNPDEIQSIVNLQAGRHTPFSRDEIEASHISIGTSGTHTKVLLVIANKSVFSTRISALDSTGVKVRKVLFAPEGIADVYCNSKKYKTETAPIGIIDIGKTSTDFIIAANGLPLTTRSIPIGREQLSQDTVGAQGKLSDELKQTLESYQSEEINLVPVKYILTTSDELTQKLSGVLSQNLNWNVEISPYTDHIKATGAVAKKISREYFDRSFLDLAAAASIARSAQVDLMPEEVELQKSVEMQGREVFRTALLSVILLLIVGVFVGTRLYFKNAKLNQIISHYKDKREQLAKLEKMSEKTRLVRRYFDERMISLDILDELYQDLPREIYLTSISVGGDGAVSI